MNLLERHTFSLLCGYKMDNFKHDGAHRAFRRVCSAHTHILPSENHDDLLQTPSYNRLIAELQQRTMALQHEVAERRSMERKLLEAKLAAELAFSGFSTGINSGGEISRQACSFD